MSSSKSFLWTLKMAWRDSRSSRKKLFVYLSAIIIGVAAQVSITSFRDSLNSTIDDQAKELLGADLKIEKNAPFPEELQALVDSIGGEQSTALDFASMAYFPKADVARLSQINAIEGGFPFYGQLETNPADAAYNYQNGNYALVDEPVMQQYGIEIGDSVKIGLVNYEITGALRNVPGQAAAASFFGPRIFIPKAGIENTGLLQRGSQVEYNTYIKFDRPVDMASLETRLDNIRNDLNFGYDTVEERKEDLGEAIDNLSRFLNLIGFIALLLGGLGVASSIYVYIRQKVSTVAVLRCFGASSDQTMQIYLIQAAAMGFIGASLGAALGLIIQLYLPVLVRDFLPVDIELLISWPAIAIGIFTGVGISIVFALLPLLAVRRVSPLFTLRSVEIKLNELLEQRTRIIILTIIGITIFAYAALITNDMEAALYFTAGLALSVGILIGIAVSIIRSAKRFFPSTWSYVWRQGFANLYRPNNQTVTLILTFGLGITLISSLYLSQDLLLAQLEVQSSRENPNLIFYDIQPDQNAGMNDIIQANDVQVIQNVPIVSMRLGEINGRDVDDILSDTNRTARRWALSREYRVTYRDSLISSEEIFGGEWIGTANPDTGAISVSASENILEDLDIALGDTLTWNVQGIPITTYLGSTRNVEWNRPQPNFFIVFPNGVLENAPQFYATVLKSPDRETTIALQRQVVQDYPNVSAFDISLIIETVQKFLDKITFVIQFMGLFSIITGLIVLASSVATSRFQRIRESVLLRTLGASKSQILKIQSVEYFLLGMMAAITGLSLSVGTTWLLSIFYFDIPFTPNWNVILIEIVLLVGLVMLVGLANIRETTSRTPLEILRAEAA